MIEFLGYAEFYISLLDSASRQSATERYDGTHGVNGLLATFTPCQFPIFFRWLAHIFQCIGVCVLQQKNNFPKLEGLRKRQHHLIDVLGESVHFFNVFSSSGKLVDATSQSNINGQGLFPSWCEDFLHFFGSPEISNLACRDLRRTSIVVFCFLYRVHCSRSLCRRRSRNRLEARQCCCTRRYAFENI